jgi:hypothetical protein
MDVPCSYQNAVSQDKNVKNRFLSGPNPPKKTMTDHSFFEYSGICIHKTDNQLLDHRTGDLICTICGEIMMEKMCVPPQNENRDNDYELSSWIYTNNLVEICHHLGIENSSSLLSRTQNYYKSIMTKLGKSNLLLKRNISSSILAYAFAWAMFDEDIYRPLNYIALSFQICVSVLLKIEDAVCVLMDKQPLYISAGKIMTSICNKIGNLPDNLSFALKCIADKQENIHYGYSPETIVINVFSECKYFCKKHKLTADIDLDYVFKLFHVQNVPPMVPIDEKIIKDAFEQFDVK